MLRDGHVCIQAFKFENANKLDILLYIYAYAHDV